jgi:hypothetical protein
VEVPKGSGQWMNLEAAAQELARRQISMFERDEQGRRPIFGENTRYAEDPHFRDLLLFHEYFHGDTSQGLGAMHQTGWTGLVADLIERIERGA